MRHLTLQRPSGPLADGPARIRSVYLTAVVTFTSGRCKLIFDQCLNCQISHRRCDNAKPCENCRTMGRQCVQGVARRGTRTPTGQGLLPSVPRHPGQYHSSKRYMHTRRSSQNPSPTTHTRPLAPVADTPFVGPGSHEGVFQVQANAVTPPTYERNASLSITQTSM